MNDMTKVIEPRSDQINADDLLVGPMTITIREVSIRPGTEQPVSISFEGDHGKPWKPCKSMCRVLVAAWGPDAKVYVGRSVTLYCDPKVKWGGMDVGGIRVSHLSHIERETVMALTSTKGKKSPFTIRPLVKSPTGETVSQTAGLTDKASAAAKNGSDAFRSFWKKLNQQDRASLQSNLADYQSTAEAADHEKQASGQDISDDPFGDSTTADPISAHPAQASPKKVAI